MAADTSSDGLGQVDGGAGRPTGIAVTLTNVGAARWLPSDAPHGGVGLGVHVQDAGGLAVRLKNDVFPLNAAPQGVASGERIHCRVVAAAGSRNLSGRVRRCRHRRGVVLASGV